MEVLNFEKSRLSQLINRGLIISGRGGSKGGGGARTPVEANDTVNSRAMASVLDLLGEGVVGGLVDGAKSIFLNDTPLQNNDGSYNFSGVTWWFRDGSQDQSVIDGFDFIETPKSVSMQLKQTSQVNVSLDSADSDRVRVVMKFPSLRNVNKENGDTTGTTVQYKFQIDAGTGKGFVDVIAEGEKTSLITLTAKKTGVYYRSYVIDLPKPAKAYTLRAIRLTEDHKDSSYQFDDTYVDSIGEIVNTSLNYPNSVLAGLKINSEQFGSSMPSRSYLIKGMKIRVPSNYNANTNTYNGNWDGTFQLMSSSNPAWILFDLLTNTRYGLGEFVKESMINIGELYQIGRYSDALVDDGFGGKEKRFSINTQITSRQDAYRVVQDIAGAFRGMIYWAGGMVHVTQDSPADPVMLFSNSNVVNGTFAYKGSARKDRYSVALVTYNNKEDGYKQSVEYVEDQEAIKRYGVRKTESVAFGCTSRGQAHRVGLWTLYTSRMESDVITFTVGMDSVFLMPGDVILLADKFRAGRRNSGRVTGFTSNSIKLDAPVDLTTVGNHITFMSSEGKMVDRDILENGKNVSTVTFKNALGINEKPVADAVWVIAQPDLSPLQARVVGVAEGTDGTSFNITAIQNNPTKYEAIDSGAQLIPQNTTVLDPTFSKPSNLVITEGTYLSSPGNLSVSLTAAWQGKSAQYYVSWRRSDAGNISNWKSQRVTEEQFEIRDVAENGQYDFQVYAVSVSGRKTDTLSTTYKVLGTLSAPNPPTSLTATGDYRSIVLNWANPSSVDLDHIEVMASKINDSTKAQLIAKVSGTTFSHNGLEDSVTWYYWVRAANKRGMLSSLNSPLATTATTKDVLSFLKNKITESELGGELLSSIESKAVAVNVEADINAAKTQASTQVEAARKEASEAVAASEKTLNNSISKEVTDRIKAVSDEATTRAKAVADEATSRAKADSDEAATRAKAISDESISRASAISDSIAVESSNRAKSISDVAATLSTKIEKEINDRAAAVTALDTKAANAVSAETSSRISAIESEAKARADGLIQEKNTRQSEIQNLTTQVQNVNESLTQQISQIAAGTGEQFDAAKIWYFDTSAEDWTSDMNGSIPAVITADGWVKPGDKTSTLRSPNNMTYDATSYRFIKLRIKKIGSPAWGGKLCWIGNTESGWLSSRMLMIDEPEYDGNGIATVTLHDIPWTSSGKIRLLRVDLSTNQDEKNYFLVDWFAIGRPTPGAGMAALQEEKTARVNADAAEATNRNTLAVQLRGSYEGNDLTKLASGLIYQEQQARVTADKAEATSRQSLETKLNDSVSSITKSLDTLNTQDKALASDITGIKSAIDNKADASALQTLKTSVDQQGSNISSQSQSITKLQNDLGTANSNIGKKADQSAFSSLQGTVTQQGKDIASANSSITSLKSSLDNTNTTLGTKANASAVSDLSSRVSSTEGKLSSQNDSIVDLKNSLSNAIADTDASAIIPNNLIINPSFERGTDGYTGINAQVSIVADSARTGSKVLKIVPGAVASPGQKIEFIKNRIYELGVWVKQPAATTDYGNGNNKLRVGNSAGDPVFELYFTGAGEEWTKFSKLWRAYESASLPVSINSSLKTGERYFDDLYVIDVTDSYNIDANTSALSSLQNTVTQQGKDITAQSASVTDLKNSLKTTNDTVGKKADSSALQSLQSTVNQQGKDISTASSDISSLKNNLASTNEDVAKKADSSALQSVQSTVTQQGKDLTSVAARTTSLENGLKTTNADVSKKADASALSSLQNTVNQQGNSLTSQGDSLTRLNNDLNAVLNMGNNLIQDANFDGDGSAYKTQQASGSSASLVVFGAYGENSQGVRLVKANSTSPGLFANKKLPIPVVGSRKFRYVIRAKGVSGSMAMLLRRWSFNGSTEGAYEDKNINLSANWQTITWDSSFSSTDNVDGQAFGIYCHPTNGEIWIDSFQVFDITDAVNNDATANALNALSTKVTQQGSTVSSQGTAITKLQNDLSSTNSDVGKKADAAAVQSLQNTVTEQGKALSSQSSSLTSLSNSLSQQSKRGANILPDGSFESYSVGQNLANNRVIVVSDDAQSGSKCIRVTRPNGYNANATDNSDNNIFSGFQVRDNAVFYLEYWAKIDPASADIADSTQIVVGMSIQAQDNSWQWPAVSKNAKDLSTSTWTKVYGYLKIAKTGIKQSVVRISVPNVSSVKAGDSFLIDNIVITEVTDAYNAQLSSDANTQAISSLNTSVEKTGSDIVSQGNAITKLQNDLGSTNANVNKKADATALQTLQNTVSEQANKLNSQSSSITSLSNSLTSSNLDSNSAVINPGNMLANASFERSLDGWSDITSGVSVIDAVSPASGAKILVSGTGPQLISQAIEVKAGRTYRYGVKARYRNGTNVSEAENTKLRIGSNDGKNTPLTWTSIKLAALSYGSVWTEVSGQFATDQNRSVYFSIQTALGAGEMYFDDAFFVDITEEVKAQKAESDITSLKGSTEATAKSLASLDSRTTATENSVKSQGSSITTLQNGLNSANNMIGQKADSSALQSLQNTVTQQGKDITLAGSSVTSLQASLNRRTVFTVTSRGSGSSGNPSNGVFDENGSKLFSNGRSYALVTFKTNTDGSTSINTSKTYDVFGSADSGLAMANDIADLVNGTYVCVLTFDEPAGKRASITAALETLGGTAEIVNSLPYRGAYILLGRKGMKAGDGLELRAPEGGNNNAVISTSVEFINGVMMGLGAAGGVMMKADANASAITSLKNTVTQQGQDITSASSQITTLQNSLNTTNSNVSKKADSTALSSLQNTVTSQGNTLTSQGDRVTSLENNLTLGDNIVPNSAMLNNAQGWSGNATSVDGYPAVSSSASWSPNSPKFAVTPGDIIDISLNCQAGAAASNLAWGIRFDGPNLNNSTVYVGSSNYAAGEKKTVSGTITVPAGATTGFIQPNSGGAVALTLYNLNVTRRNAGTLANSNAISTLSNTVTQQGKDISSVSGSVTTLQNGLKTANDSISKKADASALSALQNTVNQQGSTLTSQADSITNLDNNLNSLQIGGTNLLKNSALTDGLSGWGINNSEVAKTSIVDDTTIPNARKKCFQLIATANNQGLYQKSGFAGVKGDKFTVSFWAKSQTDGSQLGVMTENVSGKSIKLTTSWAFYSVTGVKANSNSWSLVLYSGKADTYWLSNVKLERGDKATDWSPSPEDVDAVFNAQSKAISTLESSVSQHDKDIKSAASSITSLQNGLNTANGDIAKKADASALSSLQNTVTQQGKDLSSQGASITQLSNSLSATNDSLDASGMIPGNMITNSSFERESGGYSTWSGPVSTLTAQSPRSGSKILKIAPGGPALVGQKITYVKGRTYKIGVWARQEANTTINGGTSNTKFRVADSTGLISSYGYGPFTTSWQEVTWTWTATKDMVADTHVTASLNAGAMYFDDFYVIDITDRVDLDATSNAVTSLTTRVKSTEDTVSSQSSNITSMNNTLTSLNKTVASKADTSALQSLQNTVTQQGKDLSAASGNVTSLQSSLQTLKAQSNPWIDGGFESYSDGQQLYSNTAVVTSDYKYSGAKCLCVTRSAGTSGNADKTIGSLSAVRGASKFRVEFWAMMPATEKPSNGWTVVVGLHSLTNTGGNDWQGITVKETALGSRDVWVKFTGIFKLNDNATRSHIWISTRGENGNSSPGYSLYIDDIVYTDVTDAVEAQDTANAAATALSSLQTKVSDVDGQVKAQTAQLSSIQSKVDGADSKIDQLSKTVSDSQSTQASLNSSLQSQIGAQASANIKNQADLNGAMSSISSIKSVQSTQTTKISALAESQTDMSSKLNGAITSISSIQTSQSTQADQLNSISRSQTDMSSRINDQSSSIQILQRTVANNESLNSTWMVKMETNGNGQKYAAGIALGIDGKNAQSQFLVQADRFALINTANAYVTTPFVIDNGIAYINAAYIKDGSIANAKVGDLQSNNYSSGRSGWRISKDGSMELNGSGDGSARTTISNGRIEVYDSNNRLRVRMGIF